jgi:glycosyltransferase involved in cell wall biosynthesis
VRATGRYATATGEVLADWPRLGRPSRFAAAPPGRGAQRVQVGVVIPVWRRPRLVCECLDALAAQTVLPDEVVVVDDGSGDATPEAVERWIADHPGVPVRLLRAPHEGASGARNRGLAALGPAEGVAFLDSDDLWPPDFLARATRALEGAPDAVAASADRRRTDLRRDLVRLDDLRALARDPLNWLFENGAGVGSCTLLRARTLRSEGGYERTIPTGEDSDLFLRIAAHGAWIHVPGAPVDFRLGHVLRYGEADHVHREVPDAAHERVQVYERLAQRFADRLDPVVRRRALASKWRRAARSAERAGRGREARDCWRRAASYRPLSLRLWLGWAASRWRGGASRSR